MVVYLHAQFEVSSIILTGFRQGGNPPPTSKRTPKKPTQIRVKRNLNNKIEQIRPCKYNVKIFVKDHGQISFLLSSEFN